MNTYLNFTEEFITVNNRIEMRRLISQWPENLMLRISERGEREQFNAFMMPNYHPGAEKRMSRHSSIYQRINSKHYNAIE